MALGGMIGGGIFAALGVVAATAGTSTWIAFAVGGIIVMCAAYSALALNDENDGNGGPITYIENFTGRSSLAGMAGWTFIVAYIGTTAMYAYAFGTYFTLLIGTDSMMGVPLRPFISAFLVAVLVGPNIAGAHISGTMQDVLDVIKLAILFLFSFVGLYYGLMHNTLQSGLSALSVSTLTATALAFVAFEGWELVLFDQEKIEDPEKTARWAIYIAIVVATALYMMVAFVTTNILSTSFIKEHAGTVLAFAAEVFLGTWGFVLLGLAALLSTASAVNATLFSSARFSHRMVTDGKLPDQFNDQDNTEPARMLILLGILAAVFTAVGKLAAITAFASLVFIAISGGLCVFAILQRDEIAVSLPIPALGILGSVIITPLLLWNLIQTQFSVFLTLIAIIAVVVSAELFYFEREWIEEEAEEAGEEAKEVAEEAGEEAKEVAEEAEEEAKETANEAQESAEEAAGTD